MAEDEIDPVLSTWVLEFLLRQPIQDSVLIPLLRSLPIPEDNFILKKLFLLRKLESELSNCVLSAQLLEILHQIDELDRLLGIQDCSEYLKKAYCAVAVEYTVSFLRNSDEDVKFKYFDVVRMIWRGQVGAMEGGNVGLLSEELLEWKVDIETAVWNESVRLKVLERSKDIDASEAVRLYLKEEKERTGPSFLELVTENSRKRKDRDQCRRNDRQEPEYDNNVVAYDKGKNVLAEKRNPLSRLKHVAHKRARKVLSGSSRGAKITNVDDSGAGPSCNSHLLGTPEVERLQQALESSRLELHAVVNDPLPEALLLAQAVKPVSSVANKDLEPTRGQNRGKSPVDYAQNAQSGEANVAVENMEVDKALDVQSGEENAGNDICSGQTNAPKSLMERNKTARTFEWDDLSEEHSDSSSRPHLPSPRIRRVSPLNIYKEQKLQRQRKRKWWSTAEEDALRAGVEKFGKGYWKLILNAYHDIFQERTEVDLKDKWRNMTRIN